MVRLQCNIDFIILLYIFFRPLAANLAKISNLKVKLGSCKLAARGRKKMYINI